MLRKYKNKKAEKKPLFSLVDRMVIEGWREGYEQYWLSKLKELYKKSK